MTQGFFQFNNSIINEIINFTTSSFDLLFISGEKGSSKSEMIEKVTPTLSQNNLIFAHFCFENTVIDDFLLNFYDALRNFSLASKISLKKFSSDNFKEKVSHYFKTIENNCIITVENFENVAQNVEIIDFLSHLAGYKNVKIIIVSRDGETNLFRFKKIRMQTLEIEKIDKSDFRSRLAVLLGPMDDELKEKVYETSSGLELYLKMSIKYCNTTGTPIKDLINEFERKSENSHLSYEEFLVSKFVSLTPAAYQDIFKTLCAISHPVSIDFLNTYKLGNTQHLDYLSKNFLINTFRNEIYVKDYFRAHIVKTFSLQQKVNYYKNLASIYENELTKSPKDRLLRLSRESIRKEIERFNSLIPSISNSTKNKNSISYLSTSKSAWQDEKTVQKAKLSEKLNKIKERRNFLTNEREAFPLSKKSELVQNFQNNESLKEKEHNKRLIINLINSSRDFTKQYHYNEAIEELARAVEFDKTQEFRIEILSLIAKNYEFLNNFNSAKKYYEQALELAKKTKDSRICELEFMIACIYKNLFQAQSAKEKFSLIALNQSNSLNYRAKAFIELGEIEEAEANLKKAVNCYENALSLVMGKNKELVCRIYYRLAVLYDESQDNENAVKYYKKNFLTSSEPDINKYYSISLTNFALIQIEKSGYKEAAEALKLALLYDSENNDIENVYFSQKELAKLYSKFDEVSAIGYYKQALNSAKKLNDDFKIALVYFEAGEMNYDKEKDEKALENFLSAKKILKNNPNDENIARIDSRIKDIQMRLDSATFNLITEKYA